MKNNIKIITLGLLIGVTTFSCKKDAGPSIDDYPLNYEIPKIPVTQDIPVGAYLYELSNNLADNARWNQLTQEYDVDAGKIGPYVMPELGRPDIRANETGAENLAQIVEWAKVAKIDFLITPAVKENANALYPNNINGTDSLIVNMLAERNSDLPSVNMGDLKYAIAVDIENFSNGLSNNALLETAPDIVFDIDGVKTTLTREERLYNYMRRVSLYFNDETYYHFNGRPVLLFLGADRLYTEDSEKVYDNIRKLIKEQSGKDVYIIARQPQWTPSARFEYFFLRGKVDAVTMNNMCNVGGNTWDRTYILSQLINENFKINKEYLSRFGIDFIPSASPSYTQNIASGSPNYEYPVIYKSEEGFRERCNIAKMNLGNEGMVLIESFNNWTYDSQIEPTVEDYGNGYGTKYLDIVRDEFKVK